MTPLADAEHDEYQPGFGSPPANKRLSARHVRENGRRRPGIQGEIGIDFTLGNMHSTLTPRTNLSLLLLTGTVIGGTFVYSSEIYPVVLLPFALVGLLAGLLQSRAFASAPAVFRSAESWAAVRNALMSSIYGKISLMLLWFNGAALLCLILFGGQLASLATVLAAYASFMFFRELATLRSVFALSSKESPQ